MLSQFSARGISHILCESAGRGPLEAYAWVPLDLALVPFPFADFALYPFTVINHSCEYNSMLSLVSSPNKSNLGVVLGTPTIGLLWVLSEIKHLEHLALCHIQTKRGLIKEKKPFTKQVWIWGGFPTVCLSPECEIPHCCQRNGHYSWNTTIHLGDSLSAFCQVWASQEHDFRI